MKNLIESKNKKAMLPRDVLISIVIFGMCMSGVFLMIGSWAGTYDRPYTDNSTVYTKISDITTNTNAMQDSLKASGASPVGFLEYISTGAWSSLVLFLNSGGLIGSVVTQVGADYNIPSIYILSFMAIVSITIIFGVISAIFRKKS